ncbi:MAG TPA: UDP-glucose 4-epimerase GalE [Candidatus Limnocylindria bacterium]|nr:UDP-glucose 4-epimerase GalE [Candidatus Limnocylindria bacterium]
MIETLLQAERLLLHGQVGEAERLYRGIVATDPGNAIAMVGLARVALERGDERLAYTHACAALAMDPDNPAAQRLEARLAEIFAARGEVVDRPARVEALLAGGHSVTVLDSLVTGHRAAVPAGARLVEGSIAESAVVERALREDGIEAVLHCAARSLVGESVADPALYYRENVAGGLALLEAMRAAGVERLCFSSTAAIYGEPRSTPITEDQPAAPINPYGETKRVFEGMLRWYGTAYGLRSISLRYFNVAGASQTVGEDHRPETHLIPNLLASVAAGEPLTVYGDDYPTPDGTCIRDYIHVLDLADAHIAALELTATAPPGLEVLNLGSGSGFSVLDVIRAAEEVVGRTVAYQIGPRRPGDPPVLVASNERAASVLDWQPRRGSLAEMIGSALAWRQARLAGAGQPEAR